MITFNHENWKLDSRQQSDSHDTWFRQDEPNYENK
jgi:hypothetical protein